MIDHYAGSVTYDATRFMEKNVDTLFSSSHEVMAESAVPLVSAMFESLGEALRSKRPPSIGHQFRSQMIDLAAALMASHLHYIRFAFFFFFFFERVLGRSLL